MLLVFAALGLALVFVIAAVAVGRESQRLAAQAPRPVFDLDEAVAWVADELPFEVSAVLSHADVARMLAWNLEHLQQVGAAAGNDRADTDLPPSPFSVVGESEAIERILSRAGTDGRDYTPEQVRAVLEGELAYLRLIGALGPADGASVAENDGPRRGGGDTMAAPEKGGGPAEQTL
ncbi:MAG TPA: hypothetical protein VNT56_11555 [Acidimicrobiales bacterium]|jgi:hypothetical protein|nr:hypothetical protein [Acidimicrobiales bacterium]